MEKETSILLNRIISKGGLMGYCAKIYLNDEKQAMAFIKECSEQCHNKPAIELWGEELVLEIIIFALNMDNNRCQHLSTLNKLGQPV